MKRAALLVHGPLTVVGGVERYNRYLMDFLSEEGFEVQLYEPNVAAAPPYIKRCFYPFLQYYCGRGKVAKELQNFDLILSTGYTGGFLKGGNVVNISFGSVRSYLEAVKRFYNRKFLFSMYAAILFDNLSKRGKLCVTISPQVQAELERDYGIHSVMIPCGIDIKHFSKNRLGEQYRLQHGIDLQATVGVFVGRWDIVHKGLDRLIPIMRERTDVHWVIAPDCRVAIEGIKNLTVLQNIGYEELPSMYSAADFSIQLSRYESFGFSFIESLSCSVPAISSPVGIATEVYADPILTPLLVPHHRNGKNKLSSEVHKLIDSLKDRNYRDQLATRGRHVVERDFSLEAWKQNMRRMVASVVGKNY